MRVLVRRKSDRKMVRKVRKEMIKCVIVSLRSASWVLVITMVLSLMRWQTRKAAEHRHNKLLLAILKKGHKVERLKNGNGTYKKKVTAFSEEDTI